MWCDLWILTIHTYPRFLRYDAELALLIPDCSCNLTTLPLCQLALRGSKRVDIIELLKHGIDVDGVGEVRHVITCVLDGALV